jgi:hypothetical protein
MATFGKPHAIIRPDLAAESDGLKEEFPQIHLDHETTSLRRAAIPAA